MKKPLHKHIGHHARRVHGHFTKYLYERDTIFATIWVFLFIVILGSIPLNLGQLNPIKLSMKDFDFNDLTYSKLHVADHSDMDGTIRIVNIGNADRAELSMMIDKMAEMKPKVMALDVLFYAEGEPVADSMLRETFARHPNLVVATKLVPGDHDTITTTGDHFKTPLHFGFANLFADSLSSIRAYEPFERDYKKTLFKSFTSAIIELYDTTEYKELRKKGNSKTLINYSRRIDNYDPNAVGNNRKYQYHITEYTDLLEDKVDSAFYSGKIVLFGYIGSNKYDISDKFFTPMNKKWYGKTNPDMDGIVVHANILSMVLEDNYIKKLPLWANLLIAIIVCWLHMSFFIRYYLESHIWFHLVAKLAQVGSAILFVYLGIILFANYRLKVDMKYSLLVIVLAVDVIYFYEAWAVWMHKKFGYKTVFKQHHH